MTHINVKSNFRALWVKKWLKKFVGPTVLPTQKVCVPTLAYPKNLRKKFFDQKNF